MICDPHAPPVVYADGTGPLCSCGSNGTAPVPCEAHPAVTRAEADAMADLVRDTAAYLRALPALPAVDAETEAAIDRFMRVILPPVGKRPLSRALAASRGAPDPARAARCTHDAVAPSFDADAARDLSASEVQRRWPRFHGVCPTCSAAVIVYASAEHFAAGDW